MPFNLERNQKRYPLISINRLRMETDGEGVTTLIAGSGCPLNCKYCLNKKVLDAPTAMVTAEELYEKVAVDDLYFQATEGGVTFGGGEALIHTDFIKEFRKICGGKWKIYAETSLNVPEEDVVAAADVIDKFIVDIKTTDAEIYEKYTGGDLKPALGNLKKLFEIIGKDRIRVRIPLIPDYNTEEDREKTEKILLDMGLTELEKFDYIIR